MHDNKQEWRWWNHALALIGVLAVLMIALAIVSMALALALDVWGLYDIESGCWGGDHDPFTDACEEEPVDGDGFYGRPQ